MNDNAFRITSYNIHKGFNTGNRRFLLDQIRHAIRVVDADMVFLQEVVGNNLHYHADEHPSATSQFEYLADEIWPHFAYGKNAIYEHGHHGNAILSKHPFVDWHNTDITCSRFSQRGILLGKTEAGLYSLCTHFGLLAFERERQLQALLKLTSEHIPADAPLVLAGDFNDWRLRVHRRLKGAGFREVISDLRGKPARTYPAALPVLPMDRIYYRNLELVDAEVLSGAPWHRLSDHCALSAVFAPLSGRQAQKMN